MSRFDVETCHVSDRVDESCPKIHLVLTVSDKEMEPRVVAHADGKWTGGTMYKCPVANKVMGREHMRLLKVDRENTYEGHVSIDGSCGPLKDICHRMGPNKDMS